MGTGLSYAWSLAAIGAAYKAKILCSGVFVSQRTPRSILDEDLTVDGLSALRHFDAHVNRAAQEASASLLGLINEKAVYRPGLGCTLVFDGFGINSSAPADTGSGQTRQKYRPWPGARSGATISGDVDQIRLNGALDWAFSEPDPQHARRTRAVVVLYNGRIIAEKYAPGFDKDMPLIGWSMTKSVVNALVGILVKNGRLSLGEPAPVPEWQKPDDPRRKITLDQLLHMSSGLDFAEDYSDPLKDVTSMLLRVPDMAAYAAKKKQVAESGARWSYSSGTTNIMSGIIRRVVGDADYDNFPRRALFERIGMDSAVIEPDASGTFVGSSFMYATARDWATFGQLYLQDGVRAGQHILPEGWVKYTTTPAPQAPDKEYGAHFWLKIPEEYRSGAHAGPLPDDAFHAVGHEGHFVTVIPSRSMVIVRLGLTRFASAWHHDRFVHQVLEAVGR